MQMLWTKVNACGLVEIILILLMLLPHIIHPHQLFPCGELQGKFLNLLLFLSINYAQLWSSIILFFFCVSFSYIAAPPPYNHYAAYSVPPVAMTSPSPVPGPTAYAPVQVLRSYVIYLTLVSSLILGKLNIISWLNLTQVIG